MRETHPFFPTSRPIGVTELEERTMDVKQGALSGRDAVVRRPSKQIKCAPASASKPNSRSPSPKENQVEGIFDLFDKTSFVYWERETSQGHLPTPAELTELLEANSDEIIPTWLNPIIVQGLQGKLKQRAGRPPTAALQNMLLQVAIAQYPRYLAWLTKREKRSSLTGWSLIRKSAWWVGPPHERAARMVTARWLRHMDWRSFLNRVSSRKFRRPFCE
jgi:hypothetical protein